MAPAFRKFLLMPDLHVLTVMVQMVPVDVPTEITMLLILPIVNRLILFLNKLLKGLSFINGDIMKLFHIWHIFRRIQIPMLLLILLKSFMRKPLLIRA